MRLPNPRPSFFVPAFFSATGALHCKISIGELYHPQSQRSHHQLYHIASKYSI